MKGAVLVLGARAPAALEWVRALGEQGIRVYAADSLAVPLTRFSRHLQGYFRLPEPRYQPDAWIETLAQLAQRHGIDWILPTCEEAFYLAWGAPRLQGLCRVFTSDFKQLHQLHHKGQFAALVQSWAVCAPPTQVIEDAAALDAYRHTARDWVFKPAYSRFATHTLIGPAASALDGLTPTQAQPWVVQQRIFGQEYCSYSLLRNGQLLAHGLYQPRYRVGQGSGMYFEVIEAPEVEHFVRQFGAATGYTGQVAFDLICDQQQRFWVLECNPRATSGIHLFDDQPQALVVALAEQPAVDQPVFRPTPSARMVALAMVLFAGRHAFRRDYRRDFSRAKDVIHRSGDAGPLLSQLAGLTEISVRALSRRCGLLAASTADIEWDGQPLGQAPHSGGNT